MVPGYLENIKLEGQIILWFQQDKALPHNSKVVCNYLNEHYYNQSIGNTVHTGVVFYPARSPDLTSLDYILRRALKENLCRTELVRDVNHLSNNITRFSSIGRENVQRAVNNIEKRIK